MKKIHTLGKEGCHVHDEIAPTADLISLLRYWREKESQPESVVGPDRKEAGIVCFACFLTVLSHRKISFHRPWRRFLCSPGGKQTEDKPPACHLDSSQNVHLWAKWGLDASEIEWHILALQFSELTKPGAALQTPLSIKQVIVWGWSF